MATREFKRILGEIIIRSDRLIKNMGSLIKLVEKLDRREDANAITRYNGLIKNLSKINKNAKTQLALLS